MNRNALKVMMWFSKAHFVVFLYLMAVHTSSHAFSFGRFGDDSPGTDALVTLKVVEPFIEMHTGPGRGYPVFHIVEQGERIEILKRKPGWYQIRSPNGKTGWATAAQLAHTLKPTGVPVDLPEVSYGDFLKSRWRIGFSGGQLQGSSMLSATAGYRPISWAGVELEAGQVYDQSVTSDFYGLNLIVEPRPGWVITPALTVGGGQFSFDNRQKVIVDETGTSNYVMLGGGLSYYAGRNFVLRGGYRRYSISTDNDNVGLNAWTLGLNVFF